MNEIAATHDLVLITLDTLRYDVAAELAEAGRTPNLTGRVGPWERRHTPGSFTLAAHQAFFAGFLPTPARPGKHPRRFALRFEGSETTSPETLALDAPDIVTGLRARGHHTICIGGVGFFNKQNPLGCVMPSLFDESHWSPELGVRDPRSTEHQVAIATRRLAEIPRERRVFLFVNVSALHQPNRMYLEGATEDSRASHAAALEYVDGAMGPLFDALEQRGPAFVIVCSDHGTAYGEDGYEGHRLAHPVVWDVPYGEFVVGLSGRR
ncbi:MAG: STM4013/SEN3800 family hydrolase [Myxococcales bacterium]|nr:STM4013/SEN3800 family hydrolase [Myxococcales bacterium]